jgi:hypothetical protein
MRQLSTREKDKLGTAFTPKPKKEARERVAANERNRSERQSYYERNAPPSLAEILTGTTRKPRGRNAVDRNSADRAAADKAEFERSQRPERGSKPLGSKKPAANRRIRQGADLSAKPASTKKPK